MPHIQVMIVSTKYSLWHAYILHSRAALIPGICIGIGPIPAIFDGIGVAQVCYTSTNSVVCALLTMR